MLVGAVLTGCAAEHRVVRTQYRADVHRQQSDGPCRECRSGHARPQVIEHRTAIEREPDAVDEELAMTEPTVVEHHTTTEPGVVEHEATPYTKSGTSHGGFSAAPFIWSVKFLHCHFDLLVVCSDG